MSPATNFDVIVVGLGAMGSAALYQLSRRGLRVLGLEAFEAGHQLGSSHGETRVTRMAYFEHPSYVPLLRRAYTLWRELEQESGADLLRITGGLMIGTPESDLVRGSRASAELHGLEHEFFGAEEVRRRYPAFQLASDEVALWEPTAGYLRPERCIETFVRLALARGAEVHYSEPVRAWRADAGGVRIETAGQHYAAASIVFAAGARMTSVLGPRIPPVRAERVPIFWMEPLQPELFAPGRMPIYMWEVGRDDLFYGFPHVEWPGVKVGRHHSGDFCDPDTVDRAVNDKDERRLRGVLKDRIPALNGGVEKSLVCLYENSPDLHFVIDRLAEQPNVAYAAGFSGHGFKFSSIVGEILADLVTRGAATPDADFLRATRLTEAGSA